MRYDWIEIGTSDFRTEAETAKPTDVGLSVEPLRMYLDQLPSRPSCYKAYCAVSARCGEMDVYYVHPDDIEKYGLPKYVRGCNSVGEPHRLVAKLLEEHDVPKSIIQTERVRVVDFATLAREYRVTAVHLLKVDTEGHDTIVVGSYLDACKNDPRLLAARIVFESHSHQDRVTALIQRARRFGYHLESRGHDTVLVRPPTS